MSAPESRLSSIDGVHAALDVFERLRAQRAAMDANEIRTLAAAKALVEEAHGPVTGSSGADIALRSLVADLAAASRVSERTVRRWIDDADDLVTRFEAAVVALGEARVSKAHVQVIYEHGAGIVDDDARDAFVVRMVGLAEELTPARLRQVARIAADRVKPGGVDDRHREAVAVRSVTLFDLSDGMSELILTGATVLLHGIYDKATTHARTIIADRTATPEADGGRDGEPAAAVDGRTMDQLRADVVTDLLLTGSAQTCSTGEGIDAIHAVVQITVPVLRMTGVSDEPALLAGYGPVDSDTARRLAGGAKGWERVMTSPVTGAVLAVDRYRPSTHLVRFLRARDERCRFPGCRMPVWRCDIDHTIDAAHGGPTHHGNLAHLCRHHHTLKHATEWQVRQLGGGLLEWTSPTRRTYIDTPEPRVRFDPTPAPTGPPEPPPPF